MASITEISPCCLPSCCGLKQCKISGGVNNLNVSPHCLQSCCCLESCCIFTRGGFSNFNFPPLPAIFLQSQTMQTNWSLAWNLVVFLHMVASIASIFPRCLQFCCFFTHCTIIGGLPGILLYFRTWPNNWWLQ